MGNKQGAKGDSASSFESNASNMELLRKKIKGSVADNNQIETLVKFFSDPDAIQKKFVDPDYIKQQLQGKPCKVKLVIIDLESWQDHKFLAFFVGNIGDMLGFIKFGLVHVGVQIGSYIIHWFNDSLVHFTDIASNSPLLAVDVSQLDLEKPEDFAKIREMCKVCVDYNTNKKYDNKTCNCHFFVDDIMKSLDVDVKDCVQGQLGTYLKKLKTQVLDKEFICPLTKEKKLFLKHSELDDYANELFTKINIKDFERDYPGDYALLKAFDRAFYIGKYNEDKKDPEEKDMNNMMNFAPKKCPFGDPVQTSFVPKKTANSSKKK